MSVLGITKLTAQLFTVPESLRLTSLVDAQHIGANSTVAVFYMPDYAVYAFLTGTFQVVNGNLSGTITGYTVGPSQQSLDFIVSGVSMSVATLFDYLHAGDVDGLMASWMAGGVSFIDASVGGINSVTAGPSNDQLWGGRESDLLQGEAGADLIYGGDGDDLLRGGDGNDNINGENGNDIIFGDGGNDTLTGGAGNDKFDGGAGTDRMIGELGDDFYSVNDVDDVIIENLNAGTDIVQSYVTYTLPANVENLTLATTTANIDGTGNGLANVITGNSRNNTLTGLGGNDTIDGGAGIDTAIFNTLRADCTVSGTALDYFTVSGPEGIDTLSSIERLRFADKGLSFDLGPGEPAGNAVRIIGAAFDAPNISAHPDWVGIGLSFFDSGMSMLAVSELVAPILGLSNTAFVNTVYQNVVGMVPSAADRDFYVGLLVGGGGTMTQAQLLNLAANADINAVNINLVGLQQSGVEFV